MGSVLSCCTEDIAKELTAKYGETFTKLVVAEKSKECVNTNFLEATNKFNSVFDEFKNRITGVVT